MATFPEWLRVLSWTWIGVCLASALGLLIHTLLRPQRMWIMGVVWPVTALYLGPASLWMYAKSLPALEQRPMGDDIHAAMEQFRAAPPTFLQKSIAVFHCGAGCSLGDGIAEWLVPAMGLTVAGPFGSRLLVDFALAYALGIAFQYFTIAPMRGLGLGKGIAAAARADTISILAFEVGMFGWMALTRFVLFPSPHLRPGMAVFWFMMQVAMVVGCATAMPANAWLIRKGLKEKMPMVDPNQLRTMARTGQTRRARRAA